MSKSFKYLSLLASLAILSISTAVYAVRVKVVDAPLNGTGVYSRDIESGQVESNIVKALDINPDNVLLETYAGYSSAGDLLDLSNHGRTLADTHAPTITEASLMGNDGNQIQAFSYDGANDFHSIADASWMYVFDTDFSLTVLVKSPSAAPGANVTMFSHGFLNNSGMYLRQDNATGYFTCVLNKAAAAVTPQSAAVNYFDGQYHIVTVVRNSGWVTVYVDGVPGAPVDASAGYGLDAAEILYIGAYHGPASYWPSHIAYTRLQNTAMTFSQIQKEVSLWQGLAPGIGGNRLGNPTFIRSTTSYVERKTGDKSLVQVPANWPVKTSDGGVLVEGSTTNLWGAASQRNVSSGWAATYLTPTLNTHIAPDGTQTYDQILETADNAIHKISQNYTLANATTYTMSAVMQPVGRNYGGFGVPIDRTWSAITFPGPVTTGNFNNSAVNGNNMLVSDDGKRCYLSTDAGSNWAAITFPGPVTNGSWDGVAISGNIMIANNRANGRSYLSTDTGSNWAAITFPGPVTTGQWEAAAASGNILLVGHGGGGRAYISTDGGSNWAAITFPGGVTIGQWVTAAASGNNLLFGNSSNGRMYLSTDGGSNWAAITFPGGVTTGVWYGGAASGNILLAGNYGGRAYISIDAGSNWSAIAFPGGITTGNWYSMAASGNTLLVGDSTRKMYLSTDAGSNWNAITPGGTDNVWWGNCGVSGNNILVPVTSGGRVYLSTGGITIASALWDLTTGVNTKRDASWTTVGSQKLSNGNLRVWSTIVGNGNSTSLSIIPSSDGTTTSYAGDITKGIAVGDMILQTGAFPTTIMDPSTGTHSADTLTYIPWRITKNLAQHVAATPRLQFLGSESLNGTTVTPTVGAYSFTKNGRPQNDETYAEGANFKFNGTTDWLSLPDASGGSDFDFSAAGKKFSVTVTYTPLSTAAGINCIVGKWEGLTNKRQWLLYRSGASLSFAISKSGTVADTSISVASSLEVGKPILVTATYDGTGGDGASSMTLLVDAATAASPDYQESTSVAVAPIYNSNTDLRIGSYDSMYYLNGKVHYAAVYDGTVTTLAEHQAMYAAWKRDGILPLTMSSTTAKTKIVVEFDAKGQYSSTTDIGSSRTFFSIGGNTGECASNSNYLNIYAGSSGAYGSSFYGDNDVTNHYAYTSIAPTDSNKWKTHKIVIDLSEVGNSTYTVNEVGVGSYFWGTGVETFKLMDALIRIGQPQTGTPAAHAELRNIRVFAE